MTHQQFYGNHYEEIKESKKQFLKCIYDYRDYHNELANIDDPEIQQTGIQYISSRIKSPGSTLEKLERKGFPVTLESALENLYDVIGIRITCALLSDVYNVAEWIRSLDNIEIVSEKDYIKNPKENGYRSLHFQLRVKDESGKKMNMEIQIRTLAMDFWATLEHKMNYKKKIKNKALVGFELKRCADEANLLDKYMNELMQFIEKE